MLLETPLLAAVASPRRREILRLVWRDELAAGEISRAMPDVTFGAVSLQLRALVDAGLVESRSEGRHRLYRARPDKLGPSDRCSRACGAMRSGGSNCRPNSSRHAAAPARLAQKPGWQHPERESERHEPPSSVLIAPSSSRPRRRPSSLFSPTAIAGPRGGEPGPASSRRQVGASTSATPTASRARGKWSRFSRQSGSFSPTASIAANPCRRAAHA